MQRKFVFNLILLVFLNLLIKPFYILGIDTEILERVGQAEYGIYFALMNLSFLLNIFLDMGIVNFNTNYIARHHHLVSKHFSKILGLRIALVILYLVICGIVALIFGYEGRSLYLLLPICINQILAGLILFLRSNLSGLQLFIRDSVISVLDRIILIAFCAGILWGRVAGIEMTIELFILLQMFAYGLTVVTGYLMLLSKIEHFWPKINFSFSLIVLRKSFPYALLILLMNFYYRTDGIMLERLLDDGAYEAGIYAQGFRFFEAGNMVAYLFAALLFPMFSKLIGEHKDVTELLSLSFRLMLVLSVIGGVGGFFFSFEIMELRFSSEVIPASQAFQFLMLGFIGISGTYVFGSLLTANGNLRELNILAICGAILNIGLNFLLIPELKAKGAAMASMITQIIMTIGQFILVRWKARVILDIYVNIRSLIFIFLSFLICYLVQSFVPNWILAFGIFTAITVLLSFMLKLMSLQGLIHYLKMSQNLR